MSGWNGYGYEYGYEHARRHIEEAERLRGELGDAEAQTRETFLNLDEQRLRRLLHAYRQQYGQRPYEYCIVTLDEWRRGRRKMSGMVAERIFDLLPRFVKPDERHQIAEKLWKHLSPGSDNQLIVSPGSSPEQVRGALDDYARRHIRSYNFPNRLRERFTWIANRDVQMTERLLNHFQQIEYQIAAEAIRERLPIIEEKLRGLGKGLTATASEEIRVGKHRLKIVFVAKKDERPQPLGPRVEPLDMEPLRERQRSTGEASRASAPANDDNSVGCFIWLLVAGLIIWLLNQ